MKKLAVVLLMSILTLTSIDTKAQAFEKGSKLLSLGIGGADMFHIPVGYTSYYSAFYTPLTAQLYVQGEWGIHKYVGLGFTAGIGGRPSGFAYTGGYYSGYYSGYRSEFNINAGVIANFHFYQLIADKTGKNIHADKLDIYAGLSLGTGIAIHPSDAYYNTANNDVLFFIGPQVGARYFFSNRVGVYLELGYGKTFVNAGVTFKLGGGGSSAKTKKK